MEELFLIIVAFFVVCLCCLLLLELVFRQHRLLWFQRPKNRSPPRKKTTSRPTKKNNSPPLKMTARFRLTKTNKSPPRKETPPFRLPTKKNKSRAREEKTDQWRFVANDDVAREIGDRWLGNDRMVRICLTLDTDKLTPTGNYESLVTFISTCPSLRTVEIRVKPWWCLGSDANQGQVLNRFVKAISASATINNLTIETYRLSGKTLSGLLYGTKTIQELTIRGIYDDIRGSLAVFWYLHWPIFDHEEIKHVLSQKFRHLSITDQGEIKDAFSHNKTIRKLNLQWESSRNSRDSFIRAMKGNTTIEELSLSGVHDSSHLRQSLSCLKGLKKLSVTLGIDRLVTPILALDVAGTVRSLASDGDDEKRECLQIFRRNGNLVKSDDVRASYLNEQDRDALRFYCQRNQNIPKMIASPNKVPISLLPHMCEAALQCDQGRDWVFRLLMERAEEMKVPSLVVPKDLSSTKQEKNS